LGLLHYKQYWLLFGFCFLLFNQTEAQSFSFHHLNTSNGLSDNQVRSMAIDKNGFLWIGTADGLNLYDGYAVTSFRKEEHPQMASNDVIHLTCDSRNRIWLGTPQGITWLDENRNFQRVILNDTVSNFGSRTIMETKKYGDVLYTSLGQFYYDSTKAKWQKLLWIPEALEFSKFLDAEPFDENWIMYATYSEVIILDYSTSRVVFEQSFTQHPVSVCRVGDNEIAVGLFNGTVRVIDIKNKKNLREYQLINEVNGKKINTNLSEVRRAANGDLLAATDFAGLVTIDKAGNITRHTHDPIDTRTIAANNTYRVSAGIRGEVIVGTSNSGLSIYNIYNRQAGYTKVFKDDAGSLFDNYLTEMAEDKNNILWIGAYDRLIRWDKKNNKAKFFYYYFQRPEIIQSLEIKTLCIDNNNKLWVSPLGDGVAVLDENAGTFRKIPVDTSKGPAVKNKYIYELLAASDGNVWVSTPGGVYTIHSVSLTVDAFRNHPVLKEMSGKRVISLFEDTNARIWMGTANEGIYCYDKENNQLKHLTEKNNLISNTCYSFFEDKNKNIYTATPAGFSIISANDSVNSFDRNNGLRYDKCEGFLQDDLGYIWIANTKCLVRFDPVRKTMQYFDENAGLSASGFRPGSYLKTREGELLWGTRSGINYFHTGQLARRTTPLQVNIYQTEIKDSVIRTGTDYSINLHYAENDIIFHFAAINLMGSRDIRYQYILQGYDKTWQEGTDIHQARYASLPSGNYMFRVKASTDRRNWIESKNTIALKVIPPIWQRWWFIGAILALVTAVIYWVISSRNKKIKEQKEEIERDQAINYFASSINEQQSVDNILWDVARNCIGRLQFEDCVIYLLDEERNELVQKAAHGPKSPKQFEIARPIGIPVGRGIVGAVALSGKAEIIADTSKDARYIVDDERRNSEISVPLISDGKVLGVIDCEHSKKGFFTQKHLSILTTIASLCANKVVRARAEEEKQKAQSKLMDTQQKMTEVEMQALRAQMNPHFIFNCLNSINRYIVKVTRLQHLYI
jgi:ligand-binding sensor domain-containing protein/putative methionine-R-sulfoxide reductase with GAF domain